MSDKKSPLNLPFHLPPPMPSLAYTTPLPIDQHRSFHPFPTNDTIHTPLIQLLDLDLITHIHTHKEHRREVKKVRNPPIQIEKEVFYDEHVKESFERVDLEIKHPFADIPVVEVVDLLPYAGTQHPQDFLAVVSDGSIKDFECATDTVPSACVMGDSEYRCTPNDISDYLFVYMDEGKAYFREIGACLKLKKTRSGKK